MVVVAFGFIWFLSKMALVLTLVVLGLSLVYYFAQHHALKLRIEQTTAKQTEYFGGLNSLLSGFKELKVNRAKNEDFFQNRLCVLSEEMRALKFSTGTDFNKLYLFAQCFAFILLGVILFLIPTLSPSQTTIIPQVVAIMLFLLGPIGEVVGCAPLLAQCNNAVRNIQALEADLRQPAAPRAPVRPAAAPAGLQKIELRGITYTYSHPSGEQGFTLGPVDFTLNRGETVFLVGGNGSGKSTLLKLFLNLYRPAAGLLLWDDHRVGNGNAAQYRDLFSIVLSDYHLFDRLYGLQAVDLARADELLDRMHLSGVTQIEDGRITNPNLSGGQRKRLALVVALLEEKPVYVFDEWAADQDPEFRRHFYEIILPEMKRRGATVLAATHDDRYFVHADRILKMELGNFVQP
jgi:putative ATP-binding cassette transporter